MDALLKKMNYKGQSPVLVVQAPGDFAEQLSATLGADAQVVTDWTATEKTGFALAFVTQQTEVDLLSEKLAARLDADGLLWMIYPKGTSKRYKCDFNRDTGWAVLGQLGFEPVRMVAVDEDWSALRFRRVEHIKTLTRSFALSEEGKARTKKD